MHNIFIKTLGCPKNEVDSEYMLGKLVKNNKYSIVNKASKADIIVVNTCGFINDAKEESIETIFDALYYKENERAKGVIVTGCLTQRYSDELTAEIPEIDAILGTGNFHKLTEVIDKVLEGNKFYEITDPSFNYKSSLARDFSNNYSSYLKIAEGCNNSCTYCTIPKIRGALKSRSIEDIVKEAKKMVKYGIKEIIIIAQDITQYGVDLYGERKLVELLNELVKINDIKWIRLLYAYPERIDNNLIELIRKEDKICNYLDIPIQHSSKNIRNKMGRRGSNEFLHNLIDKLRKKIPDIAIRTSLMVGFPGESEEDFQNLVEFVNKVKFSRLGVFQFSREEDTAAYNMKGQIDEDIKEKRYEIIMNEQRKISLKNNQKLIGKTLEVLVTEKKEDYYLARSQYDAPEIDNQIYLKGDNLEIGEFLKAKVYDAYEYDLFAENIKENKNEFTK